MASERIVPITRTPLLDTKVVMLVHSTLWYLDIDARATNVLVPILGMEHGAGADKHAPADGRLCWNLYNWNFGNRRGPQGDDGRYVMTAGEIIKGKEVQVSGGWPAFTSRHMGMVSWIQLWQRRYATALDRACAGDLETTCRAMKYGDEDGQVDGDEGGYFTAALDRYTAGVQSWQVNLKKRGVL